MVNGRPRNVAWDATGWDAYGPWPGAWTWACVVASLRSTETAYKRGRLYTGVEEYETSRTEYGVPAKKKKRERQTDESMASCARLSVTVDVAFPGTGCVRVLRSAVPYLS